MEMTTLKKDELENQRDYILNEIDYHEIHEFCSAVNESKRQPLQFIDYEDMTAIRDELKSYLNEFIESYLSDGLYGAHYNGKWSISIRSEEGIKGIHVEFKYDVTEQGGIR